MTIRPLIIASAFALASAASANIITQWDFNAEEFTASTGVGLASAVNTTTAWVTGSGSSDPLATGNRALNTSGYPAQGTGSGTAGLAFSTSTASYTDIVVTFDHSQSATSSRWLQFQFAIDGSTFVDFGAPMETTATGTANWFARSFDLTGVAGVDNNPDFAFRVVTIFAPGTSEYVAVGATSTYSSAGTIRYDMVTVTGIPSPGAGALMAIGGLIALRRRR
jgi:uncharacterized protein